MAMPLGVSYTDVLQKLRGTAVEDYAEAATAVAGQAAIETHIKRAWSQLKSMLPSKYRRMIEHVPGEYFQRASESQTTFTLSLETATDNSNLIVYVNYSRSWDIRKRTDGLDANDVTLAGQVVTIADGVAEDSRVIIEYDYDGTSLTPSGDEDDYSMQDMLLNIATFKAGREIFQRTGDGSILPLVEGYGEEASNWLEGLQVGDAGIPVLDDVDLYEDWELPSRGARSIRAVKSS